MPAYDYFGLAIICILFSAVKIIINLKEKGVLILTDNRTIVTEKLFTLSIMVIIALSFIFHIPKMVKTYNKNDNTTIKENRISRIVPKSVEGSVG